MFTFSLLPIFFPLLPLISPSFFCLFLSSLPINQQITELEAKSRQDLCDMRERHRLRFQEASAKLREQHRIVAKRNKQLELQLFKNSVSVF